MIKQRINWEFLWHHLMLTRGSDSKGYVFTQNFLTTSRAFEIFSFSLFFVLVLKPRESSRHPARHTHSRARKNRRKKTTDGLDGIILNTLLLWFRANFRSWVGDADVDGPDATGPSPRWEWATRFSSSARAINIWRSHLRFYQTLVVALKRKRHFKL